MVLAFALASVLYVGCGDDCSAPLEECIRDRPAAIMSCGAATPDGEPAYTCTGFRKNAGCWVAVAAADGTLIHGVCVEACP